MNHAWCAPLERGEEWYSGLSRDITSAKKVEVQNKLGTHSWNEMRGWVVCKRDYTNGTAFARFVTVSQVELGQQHGKNHKPSVHISKSSRSVDVRRDGLKIGYWINISSSILITLRSPKITKRRKPALLYRLERIFQDITQRRPSSSVLSSGPIEDMQDAVELKDIYQ